MGLNTLVVAGSPYLAYNASACLKAAGHRIDVMGTWRYSAYRLSRFWTRYVRIDSTAFKTSSPELVDDIDSYCRKRRIEFVVPADETATRLLLECRDRLRSAELFPTPDFELFCRLNDKWKFSKIVEECGASQPATKLIASPDQVQDIGFAYPVIVKPVEGTSSQGVFVVASAMQLRSYVERGDKNGELPLLVQESVEGLDMDLTILANHGRIVAWTLQERHPGFAFRFVRNCSLVELGREVVEFTKYHGVIDFDLRYDAVSEKAWLIEANPRFPGSLRYKLWAGVNLVDLGLQMATNGQVSGPAPPEGFCVDHGCSPKHLLRALSRGRLTPVEWSPYTANAWRMNLSDPIPSALLWISGKFRRRTTAPTYTAQPLPPQNVPAVTPLLALATDIGAGLF